MDPNPAASTDERGPRGAASFCIPHAALNALIEAQADVVTIGAYLTLACGTEAGGEYSTWGRKAIRERMQVDLKRAEKALAALGDITATSSTGESGPLIWSREALLGTGLALPDGPTERSKVLFGLPTFGEALQDRVWFGAGLVQGFESFTRPLKTLKDCGSVAARLLLLFYQHSDMERFGGLPPWGSLAWQCYTTVLDEEWGDFRVIHAEYQRAVAGPLVIKACHEAALKWHKHGETFSQALEALKSSGLVYPVVMALNRDPETRQLGNGSEYGAVPDDADPLYELDCRSLHGYKPSGEEGIGGALAHTCGEIGCAVTDHDGNFTDKYAAIAPRGSPLMIAGIYRLRFRVSNPLNVGVSDAWSRIREGNREGLAWIERCRKEQGLLPLHLRKRRAPNSAPSHRQQMRAEGLSLR